MSPLPPDEPHSPHAHPLPVLGAYAALVLLLVALALPLASALVPETRTRSASARVEASPRAVWSLLARVQDYPAWRPTVERVLPLTASAGPARSVPGSDGEPERPPAGWVEEDPLGSRLQLRVVEAAPPGRLVLRVREDWPSYRGRRVIRLEREPEGTRIFVGQRGSVENPVFRVADRYLAAEGRDPRVLVDELVDRLRRR